MQIETDQPARHVKLIILIEFAHIIIINFDRPAVSWSAIRPPTKRTLPGRTRNRTQDMPRVYRHGKWTVTVRAKWATSISVWVHVRLVRLELNLTFSLPVVHPSLNSAILNTILDHAYLSMQLAYFAWMPCLVRFQELDAEFGWTLHSFEDSHAKNNNVYMFEM